MTIDNANGNCCPHTTFASVNEHFRVNTDCKDLLFVCPGIIVSGSTCQSRVKFKGLNQHVKGELSLLNVRNYSRSGGIVRTLSEKGN